MKKLILWTIISSWLIHVFVPLGYKLCYGAYPRNIQNLRDVPDEISTKVVIILSAVYLISLIIIARFPSKDTPLIPSEDGNVLYYYISVAAAACMLMSFSGSAYTNAMSGSLNASYYSYFIMLFSPQVLFIIFLFCVNGRKNILLFVGSYLLFTLLSYSRQGALFIALNVAGYMLCESTKEIEDLRNSVISSIRKNKKIFIGIIIIMVIAGPLLYVYSSNNRGTFSEDETHTVFETIASRCSCLENSGLALMKYDDDDYDRQVFLEKYGVSNQLVRIVDSTMPGSLFREDVDPNQYFRYIFGYMSYENAARYYSSVNFMLPIYLIVKYGYTLGILLSILIIVGFSEIILRSKNCLLQVCMICIVLKGTLYYFDWVMIWKDVVIILLTVFVFELINKHALKNIRVVSGTSGISLESGRRKVRFR